MIPESFAPYSKVAYPCYYLGREGDFYMNGAARRAELPLSDERNMARLLRTAARRDDSQAPRSTGLPLLTDALSLRTLTLIPLAEGWLAVAADACDNPVYAFSSQMREHLTNIFAVLPLLSKRLDDVDLQFLEGLQQNCYSLLRLASNLENAGRIERHGFVLKPVDLTALIETLCYCTDSICRERNVSIAWPLPAIPVPVRADIRLLSEAFLNLVRNSLQFTRDNNRITVRLKQVGEQAVLTVEDRGLGIRPEHIEQIFDPYFSVDPYGDSSLNPGIGLGLSVVREAVHQFGGSVNAQSRFGEGTMITLGLPLDFGADAMLGSESAEYLLNRYSAVYVQLCGYCRLPGL